jgi:hypothetical protein
MKLGILARSNGTSRAAPRSDERAFACWRADCAESCRAYDEAASLLFHEKSGTIEECKAQRQEWYTMCTSSRLGIKFIGISAGSI